MYTNRTKYIRLTTTFHLTLMMASTQVAETSVTTTDNSPSQDYNHPDDQTTLLQIFFLCWLLLNLVTLTCSLLMCAFCRVYHLTGSPTPPIIENQEQEISYPNLSISWSSGDTSGCPVTMHTVYYKSIKLREEGNTWNRINASSSTRELSALPLDCDTEYELRVSAWNEMGESNRSESWKVKSITGIHINFFSHSIFAVMISKRLLSVTEIIELNQNISNVKKASL